VGEEGAAVDVADRTEPIAPADPQSLVGLEEAALAGLDADRLEADPGGAGFAADRDEQLRRLDPRAAVELDEDAAAALADQLRQGSGVDVDPVILAQGPPDLSPAKGSSWGRTRSAPSIRVTSVPRVDQA
jgi:hypothetical protein